MPVNPTYKNLEAKLRINGLTIGQWAQLSASVAVAVVFALYVSPLAIGPTLAVSMFMAGLPVAVTYAFGGAEFSAMRLFGAVWRWRRRPQRFVAGPGPVATGYVVEQSSPVVSVAAANGATRGVDLEALWDQ
ncbi:MAG: hypothetical protein V7607_5469 [Solirubrobacteraceae bacterium]